MPSTDRACTASHVVVWDAPADPPPGERIVMWRGSVEPDTASRFCAFRMVERSPADLRRRYLAWVDSLGRARIGKRTLRERLPLRTGLSAWDVSIIAERSPWRSTAIAKLLRLWAVTEWLAEHGAGSIELHSADRGVSAAFASWCRQRRIPFEVRLHGNDANGTRWRRAVPNPLRALAWLAWHSRAALKVRGIGVSRWRQAHPATVMVGYLSGFDADASRKGSFQSCFWPGIDRVLDPSGRSTVWLHRLVRSREVPDAVTAADVLRRLNSGEQVHVALESFLSIGTVLRALLDWARIAALGTLLGRRWFRTGSDGLDLHRLLQDDWNRSIRGAAGMEQCLCLSLLEAAFQGSPRPAKCLYLQENTSWERALLHAWRRRRSGPIAGIQHATVRFWDTRYFRDPSAVNEPACSGGRPDITAVNGQGPAAALRASGFPETELREVEALRFQHLPRTRANREARTRGSSPRVLVIADYLASTTDMMLRLIHEARTSGRSAIDLRVRLHPSTPFTVDRERHGDVRVDPRSLEESTADSDLVLASPTTSAVLECIAYGARVALMRDHASLDLAPFSSLPGVPLVSSAADLSRELKAIDSTTQLAPDVLAMLHLDPGLPRWKALVAELDDRTTHSARAPP